MSLKKRLRWLFKFLLFLLVVLVVLVLLAPLVASSGFARSWALGKVNESVPGELSVEKWDLGYLSPIRAEGVSYVDETGKKMADVESLELSYGLMDYFRRDTKELEIKLTKPAVVVPLPSDSATPETEGSEGGGEIPWDKLPKKAKLVIVDGRVGLEQRGSDTPRDYVTDFDCTALMDRPASTVTLDGKLQAVDGGETGIDGTFELPPEDTFEVGKIAANVEMNGSRLNLSPLLAYGGDVSTAVPGGALTLGHSLRMSGLVGGAMQANGGINIRDLQLTGGSLGVDVAKMPEGMIQFDVSRQGDHVSVSQFEVKSPFVNGNLTADIKRLPDLGEGPLAVPELLERLFATRGTAGGILKVDLQEIFAQFPKTLSVLPELVIEQGTVELSLDGTSFTDDNQRLVAKLGVQEDLIALDTTTNRRKRLGKMFLNVDAGRSSDGTPTATAILQAPFAAANASATAEAAVIDVKRLDLGALQSQIGQFVDLGHLDLSGAGQLSAEITGLQNDFKHVRITQTAFDNLTVRMDGNTFLDQDFITDLELEGQVNEKTMSVIGLNSTVKSTLGNIQASAKEITVPEQGLPQLKDLALGGSLTMSRIGQLAGSLGALPDGLEVRGGNVTFALQADVQDNEVRVNKGEFAARDLDLRKDGIPIQEKVILERLQLVAKLDEPLEVRDVDIGLGSTMGGISGTLERFVMGESGPPEEIRGLAATGNVSVPRLLRLAQALGGLESDVQVTGGMLNFEAQAGMNGRVIDVPTLFANLQDFEMRKDGKVIKEPFSQVEARITMHPDTKRTDVRDVVLKLDVDRVGNSAMEARMNSLAIRDPGGPGQFVDMDLKVDGKLEKLTEKLGALGLMPDGMVVSGESDIEADLRVEGPQALLTLKQAGVKNFQYAQADGKQVLDPLLSLSDGATIVHNLETGDTNVQDLRLSGGFGFVNVPRVSVNTKDTADGLSVDLNVQTELGRLSEYLSGFVSLPPNLQLTGDASLTGEAEMLAAGPLLKLSGGIDGLIITDTGKQKRLFADPRVDVTLQGRVENPTGRIIIERVSLDAKPLTANLGGELTGEGDSQRVDLTGTWAMDLEEVAKLVQVNTGMDLELTGNRNKTRQDNIQFSANTANLLESFSLQAGVWADTFGLMGVRATNAFVDVDLKNGEGGATISADLRDPDNPTGGGGKIRFQPFFSKNELGQRYEVEVKPGRVLDNVVLSQSMASEMLAKIHPLFRNSTVTGGRIGLNIDQALIPFDASEYKNGLLRQEIAMRGAVPLSGVRLEANGWMRQILDFAKIREREFGLNDVDMRFAVQRGVVSGSQLKLRVEDVPITMSGAYRLADQHAAYDVAVTLRGSRLPNEMQRYTDEFTFLIPVSGPADNPKVDIAGAVRQALSGAATSIAKKEIGDQLEKALGDKLGDGIGKQLGENLGTNLGGVIGGGAGDLLGGLLGGRPAGAGGGGSNRLNPRDFIPRDTGGIGGTVPADPPGTQRRSTAPAPLFPPGTAPAQPRLSDVQPAPAASARDPRSTAPAPLFPPGTAPAQPRVPDVPPPPQNPQAAPAPQPPASLEDQLKNEAIRGAGQLLEGLFR